MTMTHPQKPVPSPRPVMETKTATIPQRPVCGECYMYVPRGRFTKVLTSGEPEYFCGPRSYLKDHEETCYNKWQVKQARADALALVTLFGDYGFFSYEAVGLYQTRIHTMKSFAAMEALVTEFLEKLRSIYEASTEAIEKIKQKISKHFQHLLEILGLSHKKDDLEDLGFVF